MNKGTATSETRERLVARSYNVSYLTDEPSDTLQQMNHSIRLPEKNESVPLNT
jgi:hypothetical protein